MPVALRPGATIALLVGVALAACGRSDLGLETGASGLSPSDAGAQADAPGVVMDAAPDVASDVVERDAPPSVRISCTHLGGLQAQAPWPTMRRCPGRTANTPMKGPQKTPAVLWTHPFSQAMWPQEPVIAADGTIYVLDVGRGLLALTPEGDLKWVATLSVGPFYPQLAIRGDGVILALLGESLTAVRPDGGVLWSTPVFSTFGGGMVVADDGDVEILGANNHANYTVYFEVIGPDGSVIRPGQQNLGPSWSMPAMGPAGDLYAQGWTSSYATGFVAYRPDGTIDWSTASTSNVVNDTFSELPRWPIARDDGTIVFTNYGAGVVSLGSGGSTQWNVPVSPANLLFAAGPDGTVYAGGMVLSAIRRDGTIAWQWTPPDNTTVVTAIVDGSGTVYAGTDVGGTIGGMFAIGSDGAPLWHTSPSTAMPVAIDAAGTLYATDSFGSVLYALR